MTEKKATKKTEKSVEPRSFEDSLARLEKIVGEMEGGSLSLEQMITCFEEGQSLIKFCTAKLNEVEKKIDVLVRKGDDVVVEPLDMETEAEESDAESGEAESGKNELF